MADSVKIKAGKKANMPTLPNRELGWCTDEEALYIGTPTGNLKIFQVGSSVEAEVEKLTAALLGAKGGCARLVDTDGDSLPDTLFIADNPDPEQAVNVWRFNHAGWGISTTGYDGDYVMGASIETGIVADRITTGTLNADLIKAGMLRSQDGSFSLNLETGEMISASVTTVENKMSNVESRVGTTEEELESVKQAAANAQKSVDAAGDELVTVKQTISELKMQADGVVIEVEKIVNDGVSKVKTEMGYTFDDEGLHIQKPGQEIVNTLDDEGMSVTRGGEIMLQADKDGVIATDVKVRNFLIVGSHARFEDYIDSEGGKRTACFWIEG